MIHIDTSKVIPTQRWIKHVAKLNKNLNALNTPAERNIFIDGHDYWGRFKQKLHKLSYGKCWYSEAREIFSHYHVDHFRPKKRALDESNVDQGGYWWLTYDWRNYRLCGSVANSKKSDYFPVKRYKANSIADPLDDELFYFLDPTNEDDVKLINFNPLGQAVPAISDKTAWSNMRAAETVKWFDLDYEDLKEARRIMWKRTAAEIMLLQSLMNSFEMNPSASLRAQIASELKKIKQKIAPCAELSSTVRSCLRSTGYDWALKLLEQPINLDEYCQDYI